MWNKLARVFILPLNLLFIISLLSASSHAEESLIATQITAQNAPRLLSDSPDRSGGIGDWYLANDHVWAIIDDVNNQTLISPSGGTLVDLGLTAGKPDQFVQMLQLLNMNRDLIIPYDRIEAAAGEDWASIKVSTTHGLRPALKGFLVPDPESAARIQVETEYRLNAGEQYLRMKTTITNHAKQKAHIFNVSDIIYWGDDTIRPFGGSQSRLGYERGSPRGFSHPPSDITDTVSILRAIGGFSYIAGAGVEELEPVSYCLCSPTEYGKGELLWGINDRMVTAVGAFTGRFRRPFDIWKIALFGINPGEQFIYERILAVGKNNDAASATDIIFPLLKKIDGTTGVSGKIVPAGTSASITIFDREGMIPVTEVRPSQEEEKAGYFRAVLPPGKYLAEIYSVERDAHPDTPALEPLKREFSVNNGFTDVGAIELPAQAALLIDVKEGDLPLPARVIIRGLGATADPALGSDLLNFTVGDKPAPSSYDANWLLLSGNEREPVRVGLRPGRYEVVATHGFEYSADIKDVVLGNPNQEVPISLRLHRLIQTPGMINGDFHVHSIASMDSALGLEQRVLSLVADDVELLIATDHDMLTDYAPAISALGLTNRISSIVGVEATSMLMLEPTPFTIGHHNAWPLHYEPDSPKKGMVLDEGLRPRDLFERLKKISSGNILIQVNHGRGREPDGGASYFHALGTEYGKPVSYDPAKPLNESPNNLLLKRNAAGIRDIDFDAMELLNGNAFDQYLLLRNDWFSLLNQGFVKTATANSDSHMKSQLAGYPRNYILLDKPDAERADQTTLLEQIRNQHVLCTTGPIILFQVDKKAVPGDLISPTHNVVALSLEILAVPWIPLDVIRIYANGQQIKQYEVESKTDIVRFRRDIPLTLDIDTWLVVEATTLNEDRVQIPQPPGGLYDIIAPGFVPLAITNPIFLDINGNGQFDAPGIPPTPVGDIAPWPVKASIVAAFLAVFLMVAHVRRKRLA